MFLCNDIWEILTDDKNTNLLDEFSHCPYSDINLKRTSVQYYVTRIY